MCTVSVVLPLGAAAQCELWPPEQSASILLYSSSFLPIISPIHESEADYLVSEQFSFYGVRLLALCPIPNQEDRVSLFVLLLSLDLSSMGDPSSSYATADITLRVLGALKPHHHDKVETPLVGTVSIAFSLLCPTPAYSI
jgi:hypothetical protein